MALYANGLITKINPPGWMYWESLYTQVPTVGKVSSGMIDRT